MAGAGDSSTAADGAGVRRRHSVPRNDDDEEEASAASNSATDTHELQDSQAHTSGAENTRRSFSRPSTDIAPRVRFSTDIERYAPPPRRSTAQERVEGESAPAKRSTLSVQTIELGLDGTSEGASRAGSATRSFDSPTSPSSRNRGYSLRSTLFRRNVHDSPIPSSSNIELSRVGASHSQIASLTETPHTEGSKNEDTVITVSPALETFPTSSSDLSKTKSGKGPIALPIYDTWVNQRTTEQSGFVKRVYEFTEKTRKFILRIKVIPPSKDGRHIPLSTTRTSSLTDSRTNQPYVTNWIRSTRYSALNFVPRQLFAQFRKLANAYFLIISILQLIPGLSTTGTYTTIVPLMFFVTLSIAKEGYDDLRRHRLDKAENNREALVLRTQTRVSHKKSSKEASVVAAVDDEQIWDKVKWQNINVGDIVKLERDNAAPADLALLHTTGTDSVAYVETMALDGETNLKSKTTTATLSKTIITPKDIERVDATFVVEDPNQDLYSFEGRVAVNDTQAPLTLNEIIFRGSILRNTPSAIGLVIYSGEECRIRMNANKNPRIKAPALQGLVNWIVVVIVIFVLVLSIANTVAYKIWQRHEDDMWYLSNASVAWFPSFTSFIIMFNTMIPLSLYVSLEIVKLAQMWFLRGDLDMYDSKTDTPCEPRTSTINEDLGQVSYVFSDKTGTLTDNEMRFRKLSVGGVAWLHDQDLRKEEERRREEHVKDKGKKTSARPPNKSLKSKRSAKDAQVDMDAAKPKASDQSGDHIEPSTNWRSSARPRRNVRDLRTADMLRYMQRKPHTPFSKKARMLLVSLALCHTVLPETQESGVTHFMASSPDELALVQAAQDLGYLLIKRDVHTITLQTSPHGPDGDVVSETYAILDVIEFSSKRKRMSIIVRFPDGRICVLCKGADSVLIQRLKLANLANKKMLEIERHVEQRKSMEAQQAIRRMSEQIDRRNSMAGRISGVSSRKSMTFSQAARQSLNLGRNSFARNRNSIMPGRASISQRDEMDQWLRAREREGEFDFGFDDHSADEATSMRTPRPSGFRRQSSAFSEARSSFQIEIEDVVDENIAGDDGAVVERCLQHINDFASEGLRTLLYGYKFLNEHDYQEWKTSYLEATTSLVNRTERIEEIGDRIEQDLHLCAATAIEDKLQDGVPDTIDRLRRANIKMWMLTGDKRETAINIGYSCRLIKDYSIVTILDSEAEDVEETITRAIASLQNGSVAHSVIVVDGSTLSHITSHETFSTLFYNLAILADSVICCRASPSQKRYLVKGIRKRVHKAITLAIGDGANDIAMIQEAHIGIGITGKEGLQAARTSDYSIAQFRFLSKLLLVHGRWNYVRTCKYTVGTFWKELLFYLTQALYQRSVGYTGTSLYESWSLSMFNTLFTSLPVIFMGIFEQDLSAATLLAVPELYTFGQRGQGFNILVYIGWMAMAATEAVVVYYVMLGLYGQALFTQDNSIFALGTCSFTAVVWLISAKMQVIETHTKTLTNAIAIFLSVGGWFLWNMILSTTYKEKSKIYYVRDAFLHSFGASATWWAALILILASTHVLEFVVQVTRKAWRGTERDVWQVLEKDEEVRKKLAASLIMQSSSGFPSSTEIYPEDSEKKNTEEEEKREREVRDLLRARGES